MITISKQYSFDSAHMLWLDDHTPEQNIKLFGKCARLHGHTYTLDVAVVGELNQYGMVLNYFDLDAIVKPYVDTNLDHRFLNEVFEGMLTTAENMVQSIGLRLENVLPPDIRVEQIALSETPKTMAVWVP